MSQQIPEITVRIGVYQEDGLKEVLPCYTMTKHCHRPGFEMELIFAVMRILKWNYTFVEADTYGYQYDESDPTKWSGLIGDYLLLLLLIY
jgi:hypothetical protein